MSLSENTSKIEQLLAAISALPEAGSGEQATPEITVSSSGLITATAGDKTATKQLSTQAGTTVTPGTSAKTPVTAGKYVTGNITVKGDANLKAENIKKGVSIFNVAGSFEGSGSSGGGLPSGISALASGTYTPTENMSTNFAIPHNLGVAPNFFVWILEESMETSPVANLNVGGAIIAKKAKYNASSTISYGVHYFYRGYSATPQMAGTASSASSTTYLTATQCMMLCSSTYMVKKGYTYHWVCGVLDGIE